MSPRRESVNTVATACGEPLLLKRGLRRAVPYTARRHSRLHNTCRLHSRLVRPISPRSPLQNIDLGRLCGGYPPYRSRARRDTSSCSAAKALATSSFAQVYSELPRTIAPFGRAVRIAVSTVLLMVSQRAERISAGLDHLTVRKFLVVVAIDPDLAQISLGSSGLRGQQRYQLPFVVQAFQLRHHLQQRRMRCIYIVNFV